MFELADLVEKPSVDEAPSQLAVAGPLTCFRRGSLSPGSTQPGEGGEIQLTERSAGFWPRGPGGGASA
ncbi:MAG: hypothetical protein Ct9H300mP1_17430 [Planctomycetaceae bacterium]|nr:MAG: hypothetical protein Ct9H300mP1_17430 [Planctomycetaceae bacterium]